MISRDSSNAVIDWFGIKGREYPWRTTENPYLVLMAAFMLQRTGVSQVMNVYPAFVSHYPDFRALSKAQPLELANIMRPLGRLNRVAQLSALILALRTEYSGTVPDSLEDLERLPGLGQYSARSVMCMAYGKPYIMLDPNSYRVVSRAWGFRTDRARPHCDRALISALDQEVPCKNPRAFNLALLDLGSQVCRGRNVRHDQCPLIQYCSFCNEEVI
jgi:A/G-specific adenine glycosylase